jgi:hypothetical protein
MTLRWLPEFRNARMDFSSFQTVQVQKACLASATTATRMAPVADLP